MAALNAGAEQQHDTNIGTGKVLHQTGQQLDLVVSQSASVVDYPDSGRRVQTWQLHGLLHRLFGQHVIKAGQHGSSVRWKIDLQRAQGRTLSKTRNQQPAVVVKHRFTVA